LITRSVGEVTRPPRTRTSRFPAAGVVPFFIWTMYSPRCPEAAARALSEPAKSSRQSAAATATANRSLKTMVSSDMLDSFLLDIRQLSRLHFHVETSGFASPPHDGFALDGLDAVIDLG